MNVRPPIIAVLGHIDHGKTTLLDYIRKTNTASREKGGITQAVGAYEIEHNGKQLTFIDTPGHEAFSVMRGRGASAADIAILIVAADDGVKPQTKEALEHIKGAGIPYIVAINKIDLGAADVEKTKQELLQAGVYMEGMGGDVPYHPISAKTGEGVNELLNLVILASEMEELTYDPEKHGRGIILTSSRDPRRGVTVGVIVKEGVLHKGDDIFTQTVFGKAKILQNSEGNMIEEVNAGLPALVFGFKELPKAGEMWNTEKPPAETQPVQAPREAPDEEITKAILKANEAGSLEALEEFVKKNAEGKIAIVKSDVGDIHESDIKHAEGMGAIVIGFGTKIDKGAKNLAEGRHITILSAPVIYELGDKIEEYIGVMAKEITGDLLIKATFGKKDGQQVVGGEVVKGTVKNQQSFIIVQDENKIGSGRILNLQSKREDVAEAVEGQEVGILAEADIDIKVGSRLVFEK